MPQISPMNWISIIILFLIILLCIKMSLPMMISKVPNKSLLKSFNKEMKW